MRGNYFDRFELKIGSRVESQVIAITTYLDSHDCDYDTQLDSKQYGVTFSIWFDMYEDGIHFLRFCEESV